MDVQQITAYCSSRVSNCEGMSLALSIGSVPAMIKPVLGGATLQEIHLNAEELSLSLTVIEILHCCVSYNHWQLNSN